MKNRKDLLIDRCPCIFVKNVGEKEFEKIAQCAKLCADREKRWKLKMKTITAIVGVLRITKKGANKLVQRIP